PRKDRQAGRIGAGPGVGALLIGEKIPDGAGAGVPGSGLRVGAVEFVEEAVGIVEHEDVAIASARIGVALNGCSERNGHGAGIAFIAVGGVGDGDERLRGIHDGVGDAHVGAVVFAGTEIRVEANRGADVANVIRRVGVNGGAGDIFVPEIVAREWQEAVEAGALAHRHLGAVGGLL